MLSHGSSSAADHAEPLVVKKKVRNFMDKYEKGKHIGQGPFGHVYNCWVRDDLVSAYEADGLVKDGEKTLLTLKILKKNLLSQKPVLDDLLINEFKILMDAKH